MNHRSNHLKALNASSIQSILFEVGPDKYQLLSQQQIHPEDAADQIKDRCIYNSYFAYEYISPQFQLHGIYMYLPGLALGSNCLS